MNNRPPQWWIDSPLLPHASWVDANNVFVVGNGLLNPVAYAAGEPHFHEGRNPALFHRFASPVTYDPGFTTTPNWNKYLADLLFSEHEIRNLQEAMAFLVLCGFFGQYIILLEGAG